MQTIQQKTRKAMIARQLVIDQEKGKTIELETIHKYERWKKAAWGLFTTSPGIASKGGL
jgi:hypothetical protein